MKESRKLKWRAAAILVVCLLVVTRSFTIAGQLQTSGDAKSVGEYADPIPNPLTPPDPCDNATVRRWGKDDQKGNFNFVTPAKVLDALKLVKEGRFIRLDHLWEPG